MQTNHLKTHPLQIPKVAFPHSPVFTVPGRDTRAILSSIYEGFNVFPFHILTSVEQKSNAKMRTINFHKKIMFGFSSYLFYSPIKIPLNFIF